MSKKISQLTTNTNPLESDISVVVNSGETKKLTLGAALVVPHPNSLVWDKIVFDARPGQTGTAPAFDTTNVVWLFDDSSTETVITTLKLPHSYAEGTDIHPSVCWIQSASGTVVWQLEYKWTNRGELLAGSFTTMTTSSTEYTWTSGDLHQLSEFAAIPGTGKTVGSVLQLKFSRLGADGSDTYSGDASVLSFDISLQHDGIGTRQEYIK
jgi:hypothetical protein